MPELVNKAEMLQLFIPYTELCINSTPCVHFEELNSHPLWNEGAWLDVLEGLVAALRFCDWKPATTLALPPN